MEDTPDTDRESDIVVPRFWELLEHYLDFGLECLDLYFLHRVKN